MASDEWYYVKDGKSYPPVAWNVLVQMARAGKIEPHDQIWNEGLPRWVPAGSVEGLIPPHLVNTYSQAETVYDGPRRSSWLGALSTATGAVCCVGELTVFVIAGVLGMREGGLNESSREMIVLVLFFLGFGAGAFFGAVLGLVGLLQENSNKLLAGVGMALNAFCVLGVVGLMILGALSGNSS